MRAESQWILLLCKLIYHIHSYFTMIVLKDIYIYYSEVLFVQMARWSSILWEVPLVTHSCFWDPADITSAVVDCVERSLGLQGFRWNACLVSNTGAPSPHLLFVVTPHRLQPQHPWPSVHKSLYSSSGSDISALQYSLDMGNYSSLSNR